MRFEGVTFAQQPFEGRFQVTGFQTRRAAGPRAAPAGSFWVPAAQRAGKAAMHLLEPEAPDSFVTWGFFDTIFEQKEYGESYVLEKLARDMMAANPKLKQEFEDRLARDKDFAASPFERLQFFYRRSPWWDAELGRYPVGRLASIEGIPLQ